MCRFILYLGPPIRLSSLITEPSHSLIQQSTDSRERSSALNGDGFGLAWYAPDVDPFPGTFRSITPAWSSRNLRDLARVTRSACILAHVRAASPGIPVAETNCHPFVHGVLAFMHNGDVTGFRKLRRAFLEVLSAETVGDIEGTTDSEHVFALFREEWTRRTDLRGAERLGAALASAIQRTVDIVSAHRIAGDVHLNLAVSDGEAAAVSRYTHGHADRAASLYLHVGSRYVCEAGSCRMLSSGSEPGAFLVASEPLSDDAGWERIPGNTLVTIDAAAGLVRRPLN